MKHTTEAMEAILAPIEFKKKRGKILKEGELTEDKQFWFNEELAKVFMTKVSSATNAGFTYIKWKNAKGEVEEIPLEKANQYVKDMIATLDKIYLGE